MGLFGFKKKEPQKDDVLEKVLRLYEIQGKELEILKKEVEMLQSKIRSKKKTKELDEEEKEEKPLDPFDDIRKIQRNINLGL